jgi:hypothetical protein
MRLKVKKKGLKPVILMMAFCVWGGGCSSVKSSEVLSVAEPADDRIIAQLEASASEIHKDLSLLSQLKFQDSLATKGLTVSPEPADSSLRKPLPMVWHGPIELAVQTVSKFVDYEFEMSGRAPIQPITVSIVSEKTSASNILKDCGNQAGNKAAVIVDERKRKIELVYLSEENG